MSPLKKQAADLRRNLETRGYQRLHSMPMSSAVRKYVELHPTLHRTGTGGAGARDSVQMQHWIPSWILRVMWWVYDADIPRDLIGIWIDRANEDLDFRRVLLAFAVARVDFDSDIEGMLRCDF